MMRRVIDAVSISEKSDNNGINSKKSSLQHRDSIDDLFSASVLENSDADSKMNTYAYKCSMDDSTENIYDPLKVTNAIQETVMSAFSVTGYESDLSDTMFYRKHSKKRSDTVVNCRCKSVDKTVYESFDITSVRDIRLPGGLSAVNCRSLPNFSLRATRKFKQPNRNNKSSCFTATSCATSAINSNINEVKGTSCQSSPIDIEMELLVLPMVSDFSKTELRLFASSISPEQKKVLKKIAMENELLILNIGKGNSKYLIVRKKVTLQQKQAAIVKAYQDRLKEEEEEREKLKAISLEDEQISSMGVSCMATETDDLQDVPIPKLMTMAISTSTTTDSMPANSAARRKARRAQVAIELANAKALVAAERAKARKVESGMQTCPLDHFLCPWCTQDIPPSAQVGHEVVCKAGIKQRDREARANAQLNAHRLAVRNARRKKLGMAPITAEQQLATGVKQPLSVVLRQRTPSRSPSRTRSKSRTRSADPKQLAAAKRQALLAAQLEPVHPNDVDGMVHATQRICSQEDCTHLVGHSGGPCGFCKGILCPQHRPPHTGHECALAPLPKCLPKPVNQETSEKTVEMACGEDYDERKSNLRLRMREKRSILADKRRR